MKTVKFFRTINENVLNEYGCAEDGDHSGEYVRVEVAQKLIDALKIIHSSVGRISDLQIESMALDAISEHVDSL